MVGEGAVLADPRGFFQPMILWFWPGAPGWWLPCGGREEVPGAGPGVGGGRRGDRRWHRG